MNLKPPSQESKRADKKPKSIARLRMKKAIYFLASITILINGLLLWQNVASIRRTYHSLAVNVADTFFSSLLIARRWNALHNGVYVPVTESFEPNPYLDDPLRDIVDTTNRHLTKVNPAYMTRLIGELMEESMDIAYKITSQILLNPINTPDEWERESLALFAEGESSAELLVTLDDIEYLRYMAPLMTEESCLSCHGAQGYEVGDVRGGIAVRLPYHPYRDAISQQTSHILWTHSLVFIMILVVSFSIGQYTDQKENALHQSNVALKEDIAKRKVVESQLEKRTNELELHQIEMDRLYHALNNEMRSARRAHQHLIQQRLPSIEKMSLTTVHRPATFIGGDFSNVIKSGEHYVIYMSDVTGHGLEGTIFGLFVKGSIESYLELTPNDAIRPSRLLLYLDKQVRKSGYPSEYAVAIFIIVLNTTTGEMAFSAAGFHTPPLLTKENGSIELLVSRGLPISPYIPEELVEFSEHQAHIPNNAILLLSTDGLYEQRVDGSHYEERAFHLLSQLGGLPSKTVVDLLEDDFTGFIKGQEQSDDVSFMVVSNVEEEIIELPSSFSILSGFSKDLKSYYQNHLHCETIVMATHELVANAIEHGNQLDTKKCVQVHLSPKAIIVEDEGEGFDWQSQLKEELDLQKDSDRGRGIALIKVLVGDVIYNQKGNRATLLLKQLL